MSNPDNFSACIVVVECADFAVILAAAGQYRVRRGAEIGEPHRSATEAVLAGFSRGLS